MHPILSEPFLLAPTGEQPEERSMRTGILLIHGFTGSPTNMREMARFFADNGHPVYSMRIAGHATHPDDLNTTTAQEWLHSAEDAIHYLRDYTNRIAVVGFSFGGNLAMHVAARFPQLISHVVVIGTPLRLRKHWRALVNIKIYTLLGLPYISSLLRYRQQLPLVEPNGVYTVWPTIASRNLFHFLQTDARETIQNIQQPLFIVQSVHDNLVHPSSALHIYKHAPSKEKEILWIQHAHHYPLDGSQRDEVYRKIHRFINDE